MAVAIDIWRDQNTVAPCFDAQLSYGVLVSTKALHIAPSNAKVDDG